eukprot:GHVP01016019.1.p1 GENE.GHVP01016019.1~~GHVP01016019.1.p1  ORF type:complete len:197 (+),score=17.47 GHVP01016019.1:39-629(+)
MSIIGLFNSSITMEVPNEYLPYKDIAEIRQVPDNQEVIMLNNGFNMIIELLEISDLSINDHLNDIIDNWDNIEIIDKWDNMDSTVGGMSMGNGGISTRMNCNDMGRTGMNCNDINCAGMDRIGNHKANGHMGKIRYIDVRVGGIRMVMLIRRVEVYEVDIMVTINCEEVLYNGDIGILIRSMESIDVIDSELFNNK